jgi:hypothetical protein
VIRIAGDLDVDRPFVDDDDQEDLRRIRNGGEPLQHLTSPNRFAAQRCDIVDRLGKRRADLHTREPPKFVVVVAVLP